MRAFVVNTIFLFLCIPFISYAQLFQNAELSVTKIDDNAWVIETIDNCAMYVIEGKEKAMLIDTGTKCETLSEAVKKITNKPLYVVLTHCHTDHAGNINAFNEIWLHPADTLLMNRLNKPYGGKINYLKDGQIFDLGETTIEVRHMPGHTPGSVVFLDRKMGNCYSGDAFGSGMVWLQLWPFSTMKTYIESCKKMEQLMDSGIFKIYCGHYPYVKRAFDKSYITAMRQLAEDLDSGKDLPAKPFPVQIKDLRNEHPMFVTRNGVSIVYEPDHIK